MFEGHVVPAGMVRYLRAARRAGWKGAPISNQDAIRQTLAVKRANYEAFRRERGRA